MKLKPHPSIFDEKNVSYPDIKRIIENPGLTVLLDTLSEGLVIADQKGVIVFVNSAAESINEINREHVLGRTLKVFSRESVLSLEPVETSFLQATGGSLLVTSSDNDEILTTTRLLRGQDHNAAFCIIIQYSMKMMNNLLQKCNVRKNSFKLFSAQDGYQNPQSEYILKEDGWARIDKGGRALKMGSRVLLTGESGTGKTFAAQVMHEKFIGKDAPFIRVNCASIPEPLFESELFGYERGAFTGAHQRGKKGLIEAANGGTLFLDEVGEIPLYCQPKLLQFLEAGMVQRLGATTSKQVNVNIIAATNRDLEKMVAEGTFRKDLFYRLCVIRIKIPPLRETRDIIPELIENYLAHLVKRRGRPLRFSKDAWARLVKYDYPGNIRELQNIVEHLAVECDEVVKPENLPECIMQSSKYVSLGGARQYSMDDEGPPPPAPAVSPAASSAPAPAPEHPEKLKDMVRDFELTIIENAIELHGSKRKAAQALGVDVATIVRKTNYQPKPQTESGAT